MTQKDFIARAIVVLLVLFAAPVVSAERNGFRTYSVEEGLPQSQVSAVLQDCDGYLWAGMHGAGLSRFDGNTFKNFSTMDGLAGNVVRALAEAPCGTLWVGTDSGLSRFDGHQFRTIALPAGSSVIRALSVDQAGVLWIATESGAFRYDERQSDLQPLAALADQFVSAIHIDPTGPVWFGTPSGLIRVVGDAHDVYGPSLGLPKGGVIALAQDHSGTLWIGTGSGLASWDGNAFQSVPADTPLGSRTVHAVVPTNDGELWAGTAGAGVCRLYGSGQQTCFSESAGLPSPFVWALTEDREGNLWAGTYRAGLARFSDQPFNAVPLEATPGIIRAIRETRDGSIWIGTFRDGAVRLDAQDRRTATLRDELASPFVLTIFEDSSGAIWFGTYGGVSRLADGQVRSWTTADGLPDNIVRDVLEDRDGRIWIATNSAGIGVLDGDRLLRIGAKEGLGDLEVMALAEGDAGMWIGTLNGIYLWDGSALIDASERFGWIRRNIYSLVQGPGGELWIAAYGAGVFRCRVEESGGRNLANCDRLGYREGLPNNQVVSLIFDPQERLWVGTENGVVRVDVANWTQGKRAPIRHFGRFDGFGAAESVHNAAHVDSQGRLWFGTVKGVYRHASGTFSGNVEPPRTMITSVQVIGADHARDGLKATSLKVDASRGQSVRHPANGIDFGFVGISLSSPEGVRFRYRLRGVEDWSEPSGSDVARFRNLAAGDYVFEVEAANSDGVWNQAPASYAFAVTPPFWKAGWFIALVSLGALATIGGGVKLRLSNLDRQNRRLQERVVESTAELARINAGLERQIASRTKELVNINERLRGEIAQRERLEDEMHRTSKLESLAVLAGGIAHDFNNLLAVILGNISLAKVDAESLGLSSDVLDEAERACLRSRDLTTQLLTFSKGGAPVRKVLSVERVAREGVGLVLRGSKLRPLFEFAGDLWRVDADEGQLGQVLGNLALNAAQVMPGGGHLHIRGENVVITPGSSGQLPVADGKFVRLSFRDEGPGIDREVQSRIFDPYFTTKESGHGLGLATAYSIMRRHGGWIDVESTPGAGATLCIYLPATDEVSVSESPICPSVQRNARVLLMDDEAMVRDTTATVLRRLGCTVVSAEDGLAAIEFVRESLDSSTPFDVVILDLTVPGGMGGTEAVGEIRDLDPEVPVIVSSGYSDEGAMGDHRSYGFFDVLPKPFTSAELERVLDGALADRRAPR